MRATYQTRWLVRADLPQVADIDAASFAPIGVECIVELMRERNVVAMVITPSINGDDVRGFMLYRFQNSYLELIALAVHPMHLREGIATSGLTRLVDKLDLTRRRKIHASVDERHLSMQQFLRARRFIATHVTEGAFFTTYEFVFVKHSADIDEPTSLRRPENRIANYL